MKKLTYILFLLVGIYASAVAETTGMPAPDAGPMLPYDFSLCDKDVAWADTLQPIFVSYTARHGARYLTSAGKFKKLYTALSKADKEGQITEEGKTFLEYLNYIKKYSSGKWGLLSNTGIKEEQKLGADMAKIFPKLLKQGSIKSESTSVPRVIMTMYQFMHAMEIPDESLEMTASSGNRYDSILRCFDYDPAYSKFRSSKGEWNKLLPGIVKRNVSPEPARKMFKSGYIKDDMELRNMTIDIYSALQGCNACGYKDPPSKVLSEKESYGCWVVNNFKHYMRNSINPVSNVAAIATMPLLNKIISDIDWAANEARSAEYPQIRIKGNFGHAETLLPLLSIMRIPGAYYYSTNYDNLAKEWKVQEITPLAANLMIILLRGESGEMYVSVRQNGKNIAPISGKPMILKWSELKAYWQKMARQSCKEN